MSNGGFPSPPQVPPNRNPKRPRLPRVWGLFLADRQKRRDRAVAAADCGISSKSARKPTDKAAIETNAVRAIRRRAGH